MNFYFSKDKVSCEILKILLFDRTTEKNIIWATGEYKNISAEEKIQLEQINLIQPRFKKLHEQQKNRTRDKAEIFTPSWLCNEQNNLIDEKWFGKSEVFNRVVDVQKHLWQTTTEKIIFSEERTWQDYVEANRLEISCGEAPYLVSRYDAVTGEEISVENRIGLLDRKLRVVNENVNDVSEWLNWAEKAVQSIYGYEFQGDNLFLARLNIFLTVEEFFFEKYKFECDVYEDFLRKIAEIISWNLWQMDGLEGIVPYSDRQAKAEQISLLNGENTLQRVSYVTTTESANQNNIKIYCKIRDWKSGEEKTFANLGVKANGKV